SWVGTRWSLPNGFSVAWLQRGCGTLGFTLAQKPYSLSASFSQNEIGRLSLNSMLTIALTFLKPYFHGATSRSGAPFCLWIGLPYRPVAMKARSLVASSIARPSVYGQG